MLRNLPKHKNSRPDSSSWNGYRGACPLRHSCRRRHRVARCLGPHQSRGPGGVSQYINTPDWPTDFGGPAAYRGAIDGDGDRNDYRGSAILLRQQLGSKTFKNVQKTDLFPLGKLEPIEGGCGRLHTTCCRLVCGVNCVTINCKAALRSAPVRNIHRESGAKDRSVVRRATLHGP